MVRPESHRRLTGASPVMELPEGHVADVQCISTRKDEIAMPLSDFFQRKHVQEQKRAVCLADLI
jgi:hypothetical protein